MISESNLYKAEISSAVKNTYTIKTYDGKSDEVQNISMLLADFHE